MWRIERAGPVTADLRIEFRQAKDWGQWGLVLADEHIDHPDTDIKLLRHHLDQARERGAFVLSFGDQLDAMQGKSDRRSSKRDLLREFAGKADDGKPRSYLNRVVRFGIDFYKPYADMIALMGRGNHESSVDNILEYDMHDGLLAGLSQHGGDHIIDGGYRGWIRFLFHNNGSNRSRVGYYHHGHGGGGAVTRDVIQANRRGVYLDGCDYVFSGHTHDQWVMPVARVGLSKSGQERKTIQYHVKIPSYKDEFTNKSDGWSHEKGHPPKPAGAWWMQFYWSGRSEHVETKFIEADR